MAPAAPIPSENGHVGPHPSYIEVAKPYIFEQKLQEYREAIGINEAREDSIRLQGIAWIDSVRKALQLPVRTYNTAAVYYHKFRLVHPDSEYNYIDAAAAALFTACKIEDTLKKSREILCASYNLKIPPAEHLSPDDPLFEPHAKAIIGLERLMLEAAGFDFRSRYPQKLVIKIAKSCGLDRDTVGRTAYNISLDMYRTFAPLKQATSTMAIACVELASRLCGADLERVLDGQGLDYKRWCTTRAEVMETLLDLLDLYTHHRPATIVGLEHPLDAFISIRIPLNQEASASSLPRYTNWEPTSPSESSSSKPAAPAKAATTNGVQSRNGTTRQSPRSPADASPGVAGTRGQHGTVRFMLDAARAAEEKRIVDEYFKVEEEEYEVEVEVERSRRSR